jgi:tyrosyl-tRNA synthetase
LQIYNRFGCAVQLGEYGEWDNITTGIDLIKAQKSNNDDQTIFGVRLDNFQFAKLERGDVWLDSSLFSIFDFYQVICC